MRSFPLDNDKPSNVINLGENLSILLLSRAIKVTITTAADNIFCDIFYIYGVIRLDILRELSTNMPYCVS